MMLPMVLYKVSLMFLLSLRIMPEGLLMVNVFNRSPEVGHGEKPAGVEHIPPPDPFMVYCAVSGVVLRYASCKAVTLGPT